MSYTQASLGAVEVSGLTKSFGQTAVLTGLDLRVETGTIYALLGPNGAGKTTAVRILATLLRPDSGHALVAGHDLVRAPERVRPAISLTGQFAAVDGWLTGAENLELVGRLQHLGRAELARRSTELLERLGLSPVRDRKVTTYSGGMQRKLDLAMSLVGRPQVVFLDEPTTGLDPRSRRAVWDFLRQLVTDGVTIFLTTQYLDEADQLADRIGVLADGRLRASGTAPELKALVGADHLVLQLDGPADTHRAAALLARALVRADVARRQVTVMTDGSACDVRHVLDLLHRESVAVATVAQHRPTLDDVFFALTGTPTESEELAS